MAELTLVETVADNKKGFSRRQLKDAKTASDLLAKVGHPSVKDLKNMIQSGLLKNCPVTLADVDNAITIYGPDIASLKGKTTRTTPARVRTNIIPVPPVILSRHKLVTVDADIFIVNKLPFFTTLGQHLLFNTIQHLLNRRAKTIMAAIITVQRLYRARGFVLMRLNVDNEFMNLTSECLGIGITLNVAAANEHVPAIERRIRVIKERVRATRHTLPYKCMPKIMVVELVKFSVFWLNAFPAKGGVSTTLSPRTLLTGMGIDFATHCRLSFGSYVQTHEENFRTNGQQARTLGAITLGPDNSSQGGYNFYNLNTGMRIHRRSWTPLPMPDFVIRRVEQLGRRDGQPDLLIFTDKQGEELMEEAAPEPNNPDDDDLSFDNTEVEPITGVDVTPAQAPEPPMDHINDRDPQPAPAMRGYIDADAYDFERVDVNDAFEQVPLPDVPLIAEPLGNLAALAARPDAAAQTNNVSSIDDSHPQHNFPTPATGSRISQVARNPFARSPNVSPTTEEPSSYTPPEPPPRRSTRTRSQVSRLDPSSKGQSYDVANLQFHCMTQLSMRRGLKIWGNRGEDAVFSELQQLHLRNVFTPVVPESLSPMEKKKALESHLFLKEKRDLSIKGRLVAGGNKQRSFTPQTEATSPTPHTESVFITSTIEAMEERDVAAVDIPNAFVQTDLKKDGKQITIIMVLRGKLAILLIKTAPDVYKRFATKDRNGNTILYVRLMKALYGIMQASLLYYTKTIENLQAKGFKLNPYDQCVANKKIKGKQCTIIFHVDDMKISHADPAVVTSIIKWLQDLYQTLPNGEIAKMKVQRGKFLEYLGMDFDYSIAKEVKITMKGYIKSLIKDFKKSTKGKNKKIPAKTPAHDQLFHVRSDAKKLDDSQRKLFHHTVAQLLYLFKRTRPDLSPAVPFLTTRVSQPDEDDWKKLCKTIQYLENTIEFALTLAADKTKPPRWWIDASYAVHPNCRSHTGGTFTLGKGAIFTISSKQKINTKSSTEAELVAVDDCIPHMIWVNYFLYEQGYHHPTTIVYQDNRSAILLEQNGTLSSTRRTKHINVRYYFIKDKIDSKEIVVKWCPTDQMIADFHTKPLTGDKFRHFRKNILNLKN